MEIVGGLYYELCCRPAWSALYGSGGRAAAAISKLSPNSALHTYGEDVDSAELDHLREHGIRIRLHPRDSAIAFSYFHPLSRPHVYPAPTNIRRQPLIRVSGETVLRFGFLEGDAVVQAKRAIYDPQTWHNPSPFFANGSNAEQLAIVLNEQELINVSQRSHAPTGAAELMSIGGAEIVIAKAGPKGATVYQKNHVPLHIPSYRSSAVFKIGTGDIFTALFAHYWGECDLPAPEAADLASRSVAIYCDTLELPLPINSHRDLTPIEYLRDGSVLLEGPVDTLGQLYTMEEARFVLQELGPTVFSTRLDGTGCDCPDALLIIGEGNDTNLRNLLHRAVKDGVPTIVLEETPNLCLDDFRGFQNITIKNEFVTAIYFAAWAACSGKFR